MSKYAELFDAEVNTLGLAPEGEEPSKYAELFDSEVNLQQEQARTMIETALKDDPEIAAERVRLSETSGVPLDVVQRNIEELRVKERARAVDLVNMAQESPILYRQLTDPAFVTTAIDDLDTLKNIEKAFTRSIDYVTDTDQGLVADAAGAGRSVALGATVGLGAGIFDLAGVVNDLIGAPLNAQAARQQAKAARESMQFFGLQGDSSTAQGVRSGLESAGQNLAILPLGLARNLWATANQAASAVAGVMSTFVGAEAYNRARELGRNKLEAAAFAIPQAGFEYVFEKIPASKLFGDIAADEKFLRLLGKQLVTEGWTEQVTTLAQDFNEWMNLNPKKTLAEFVAERPEAAYQTFVATLVGVGVQTSAIKGIDAVITRASDRQLRFEQDILQRQMELARDSALRARSPEMFRAHIERVQNSDEGAKKEIYVDAEALNQLPPELLNQLPEAVRQQIPEALAANSTVSVPMADVLTVAPGSDLETFFNDNARVRPNARTRAEAQLTEQLVAEEADRVLQQAADQAAWSQSADTVRTRVLDQLNATGRWSPEVNEAYATLQANFFSSMAARAGLTPEQLFDRYQLKVQARMPGAADRVLNAGDVTVGYKPGTQFLEARTEAGMVGGTVRDGVLRITFAEVAEDQRGTGEGIKLYTALVDKALADGLRVTSDFTVEAPAVRMYEALQRRGYTVRRLDGGTLADGAVYGTDVNAPAFEVLAGPQLNQSANPFDGAETPATRLAASTTELEVDGAMRPVQNSNGQLIHWSEEGVRNFWRWFGDSKVVDDQGRPLVVYHGSRNGRFSVFQRAQHDETGIKGVAFAPDKRIAIRYANDEDRPTAGELNPEVYAVYLKSDSVPPIDQFYDALQDFYGKDILDITQNEIDAYANQQQINVLNTADIGERGELFAILPDGNIKSATENIGTFDQASADVFNQTADGTEEGGGALIERLQMVAERGQRVTGTRALISAEEKAAIKASADKVGISEKEITRAVREHKLAHPTAQGWAPLIYIRTVVDEGKVIHEYKAVPYSFSNGKDGKQLSPGTADYQRRINAVARGMLEEVRRIFVRAGNGDKNAQNILAQAGWYKSMRTRLRQEFGGLGDLFADLLGATSPNTPVRDNWTNAVDALRRASRGDFDTLIPQWEAWSDRIDDLELKLRVFVNEKLTEGLTKKAIKALPEYKAQLDELKVARKLPDNLLPTKETGKKYGFNGRNVARAMVDLWRVVKNADPDIGRGGTKPKALNFSGNLIGFRERATIDVWAARMLQRLSGGTRIPSMAETGVSGEMREDGTTTLQFGFGQDVFSEAVKRIRADQQLNTDERLATINDDDLQAVVWFVEKELWTINNWTNAAGEGGSFELEANLTGPADQERIRELRRILDSSKSTPADKADARAQLAALERTVDRFVGGLSVQMSADTQGVDYVPTDADMARLSEAIRLAIYESDDGATVLGSKALSTEGRYGGVERSLDLEVVAREGYDANTLWLEMLRQAQAAQQDSTFLSRVLRDTEAPDPLVHRPGVEIYFRDAAAAEQLEQMLADLEREGVSFLTVIVDGRRLASTMGGEMPAAVGVRLQYVPEFEQRYGIDDLSGLDDAALAAKVKAKADELAALAETVMGNIEGISFAGQFWYETQTAFSSNYQEKIDGLTTGVAEGATGEVRSTQWAGQPIRQGLESADRQVRETTGREPGGDVLGGDAAGTLAQTARLTPEQLTWAEGTQVVDETGQPQVMYTGTAADITEFRPGQAGAIYVSPNPAFASGFAESAARRADGEGAANVLPVIVRATNIFDPANPDHREGLRAWLTDRYGEDGVVVIEAPRVPPMRLTPAQLAERIASGNWMYVESPVVQEYIRAAGHDGFWTVERKTRNLGVFEPNQLKSVFNRAPTGAPGILNQNPQAPLGTFNPEEMLITLGESANLSTFLHESGHYFLEVLADIAADPATPQEIRDDWATAMAWGGFTQAQWDQWQAEYQATKKIPAGMRNFHERWAESFEAYLFEGKAPSAELQPLFRRFRSWLLNVYQSLWRFLQNRNLQMNDEIRAVFDRMLATDEQIRQAEEAAGLLPDFNATNEAIEQLQARSLRDLRWTINARGRELKKLEKEAKGLRKGVEAEVRAEVERQPIYRAMTWLKKGEMVDEATGDLIKADKGFRLDTAALKEMYPESMLARPDTSRLRGMTGKDGLHPDLVAEMFGFETGDALVRAIINAEPIQSVVDGITDQRMLERHGDLATPEAREEAANEAVHNEARARALATELKAQSDMLRERQNTGRTDARGRPITINALVQAAKDFGATIAARRTIRELKNAAWQHRAAEARAGKRWDEATRKGQTEAAVQAKRDQMLNNAAAKALQEAQAEVREIVAFFRRVVKDNNEKIVKKGRDPDVVNAMRAILAAYGVAPRLGKSALEYMEAVKRNDPAMYNALAPGVQAALVNAMPLQELTMEELRGLNDELRAMWDLAKRSRKMEIDGNLLDLEDLEQELMNRMQQIGIPSSIPGEKGAITDREERSIKLQFAKAILSRVEQWAERLDGKYGGPFLRLVFRPVKEAADRYRAARVDYRQRFTAMLEAVAPMLPSGPIAAPELGYTFGNARDSGTAELLHAILHTGNQSNKRKLLLGRGWATENPDGSLNTGPLPDGRQGWDAFVQRMHDEGKLQKAHYDFAQGVWDLLEEMKPLAQKTHREVYGRYFAEVTADELVTPFGTYRGGYVPAQTDSRLVKDAKLRELAEGENESMAYAFPAAPSGFTKARVEYNKPLMLDLRVLAQHLDKVLLFSHMQGPINDVRRLLTRKQVSTALDRIDPAAYEGMLIPWLNRSARQIVETPVAGDRRLSRFLSAMRNRAGMALMFANLSNAAQQITGFSMAAVKVKPGLMLEAAAAFIRNPKNMQRTVAELSPYMKDRMLNEMSALNDAVERILVNPTWLERSQEWTQQHAYFLQTAVDRTMSPIIWTAAYNQAIGEKMSERDAARFADGVIRQTQGSTLPEDVSRFETGPAYGRLFTQFVGYFNMMANTNATAVSQIAGEMGLRKGAGRLLYVALAGLLVPIWVAEAIAQGFRGGPDDEDEDGYLDDWLAAVFGLGTVRGLLAQVPVVGQFAQIAVNRVNDNPADDKFSLSPAVSLLESAAGAPVSVYKAVIEDGNAQKALRDTAAAATLLTGLPIFGVVRPVGYAAGVAQGKIEPTGPIDLTRGLVTGTAAPESRVP